MKSIHTVGLSYQMIFRVYYSIMHISPIAMDDFLIGILSIPLIDTSLQMDLYIAYNLPTHYPELKVLFTYASEGQHLTIYTSGTYPATPTLHKIYIFLATQGHLCTQNTALSPVEKTEWCIYALFIKDHVLSNTHYLVDSHTL